MDISGVKNGIVIDHIKAGNAMRIYNLLGFDELECSIAIIKNVSSKKMGKKDIIKVDSDIPLNLEALGYIDPDVTVDVIRDGKLVEKRSVDLPEKLHGVLTCKNPRCITTTEQELPHVFRLTDANNKVYRCIYCETKAENK